MKKMILSRCFSITVFCLASVAIKSETATAKNNNCETINKNLIDNSKLSGDNIKGIYNKPGIFFIKI